MVNQVVSVAGLQKPLSGGIDWQPNPHMVPQMMDLYLLVIMQFCYK
jgi:hypothetical protein